MATAHYVYHPDINTDSELLQNHSYNKVLQALACTPLCSVIAGTSADLRQRIASELSTFSKLRCYERVYYAGSEHSDWADASIDQSRVVFVTGTSLA